MDNDLIEILTLREREVLDLLSRGKSDAEIAETLFVSVHTAKTHVRHILEKLEVRSRHQAADLWRSRSSAESADPSDVNAFPRAGARAGLLWRRPDGKAGWAKTVAPGSACSCRTSVGRGGGVGVAFDQHR
jgi:DNA-binding CsgD family transcriptional regulator